MARRAFSLLELLIALTLVVAMIAVSAPVIAPLLDERLFESTADDLLLRLRLARAHAQAEGRAVEVIYAPDARRVEARHFDPEATDDAGAFAAIDSSDGHAARTPGDGDADSRSIPDGWARLVLDTRCTLAVRPPDAAREQLDEAGLLEAIEATMDEQAAATESAAGDRPAATPLRLAIFLPDGAALLAIDTWLSDAGGRVGRLGVNPFTGLPRFERLKDIRAPEQSEPPEEEPADDEPETPNRFEPPAGDAPTDPPDAGGEG